MSEKISKISPKTILHRGRSKTPPISFHIEFVDTIKPKDDSKKITAKDIDNYMIPPTLFEVIENVPERILDHLKRNGSEHNKL